MEKYRELAQCVENIEKDASKFFVNGNKAAGTRARKHLQELKKLAQQLRVLIQEVKNDKSQGGMTTEHDQELEHDQEHEHEHEHEMEEEHEQHQQQQLEHQGQNDHENEHSMAYVNHHQEQVVKYDEAQHHDANNMSF